jgi:hypothetical protein
MRPFLAFSIATLFFLGCPPAKTSPTFLHIPDSELCPAMCAHFRELKCAEGEDYYDNDKPGPKGVPNSKCEDFCTQQQTNGIFVHPRCLLRVPTCNLIESWRNNDCADGGT